ncbi:MAG: GNAT family N-acetyltransferase [Cellulosilyticaceae bacterium]
MMTQKRQWMIKSYQDLTRDELYEIVKARFEVFVMEQRITCENDFDDVDKQCHHIFTYENGKVVAYARLIPSGISYETASIGRVLVLEQVRRKGVAKEMMERSVEWMSTAWDIEAITLSAQEYVVPLYESVGFRPISEVYEEAEIPHVKMKYTRGY